MSGNSKIEWTGTTWNPTTGCEKVSPGCDRCYIETTPPFRMEGRRFLPIRPVGESMIGQATDVRLHPDRLSQPLHWTRAPRVVFVNSLSDLAFKGIPDEYIAKVFAVMALAPAHTFQLLTKRPARLRSLLSSDVFVGLVDRQIRQFLPEAARPVRDNVLARGKARLPLCDWPLPNVWVGVSVEDQERADLRIPILIDTPAAVRFLSCEPLLGPVDLSAWMNRPGGNCDDPRDAGPDWVIVGGESGRGARRMDPAWADSLQSQCESEGIPFFYKQYGTVLARELGLPGKGPVAPGTRPQEYPHSLATKAREAS